VPTPVSARLLPERQPDRAGPFQTQNAPAPRPRTHVRNPARGDRGVDWSRHSARRPRVLHRGRAQPTKTELKPTSPDGGAKGPVGYSEGEGAFIKRVIDAV